MKSDRQISIKDYCQTAFCLGAFTHYPGARLCPAERDQPQQLRKTSLLEYT